MTQASASQLPTSQGGPGATAAAVRHHYDAGNDFYRLFLGSTMVYSCALWDAADSLDDAQRRKIDLIADLAGARDQARVLDVGCGWGAALERLVSVHGVGNAVGLTLSSSQAEWIRGREHPAVTVEIEHWESHDPRERYDGAISIGAFEHFARPGLGRKAKIAGYRSFFSKMHELLRQDACLGLQTMAVGTGRLTREDVSILRFLSREIFPQSMLPRLSEIVEASHGLFEPVSLRNDRLHYARTCAAWLENLKSARSEAVRHGHDLFDRYVRYFGGVIPMFERGQVLLLRMSLRRVPSEGP